MGVVPNEPGPAAGRPVSRDPNGEVLVFIYGSHLRGETNHALIGHARFLAEVRTSRAYELVDMGGFPALVNGTDRSTVVGEVYGVDPSTLLMMDEQEDHPVFYRRQRIEIDLTGEATGVLQGREVVAYVLPEKKAANYPRIASGDWRLRASAGPSSAAS